MIIDELILTNFTATAKDNDLPANPLSFSLADGISGTIPVGASITTGGVFNWTPTETQGPGDYIFDVCVSDGALSDCKTITLSVNEVNVAPVLDAIGNKSIYELATLTFTASASDSDLPENPLTFQLSGEPVGASINGETGVFSWIPTDEQGPGEYTFDVCVSDGDLSDCETITVDVMALPTGPIARKPAGTITQASPSFRWTVIPGASQYHLVVTNKTGSEVANLTLDDVVCGATVCNYTPDPGLNLPNGKYTWKVQAYTDTWSLFSAIRGFVKVKPPTPRVPRIATTAPNPKLYWRYVPGQTKYEIDMRTASGSVVMNIVLTSPKCNEKVCHYLPDPALGLVNGTYKWRVRSMHDKVWGDWSDFLTFRKVDPPSPVSPSGTIYSDNPTFTWSKIDATVSYMINIRTLKGLLIRTIEVISPTCDSSVCSYTPSPSLNLVNGNYKWRVQANNGWYYGPYSEYLIFTKR
jgi:hypothetical protein